MSILNIELLCEHGKIITLIKWNQFLLKII